jgi:hypothetical protein
MLKSIKAIALVLLSSLFAFAQPSEDGTRKIKYAAILGLGASKFEIHQVSESPHYGSFELRLGLGIIKPLGKYLELKSGLSFGIKMKRESYYFGPYNNYTREKAVLKRLDEATSNRNHFMYDLPLVLQYNLLQRKMGLRIGLNARFWTPKNDDVDVLTSLTEIGSISGVTYRISNKINAGIDAYFGVNDIYFGGFLTSGSSRLTSLKVTNQYAQFTIEYFF